MKILVTGAYGNIGRAVLDEILKRNHEITVFEKKNKRTVKAAKKYKDIVIDTIFGDITNYPDVKEAVAGMDAIIHLAAIIPPHSNNRKLCFAVNVDGTENVVNAIKADGNKAVLIHSSSCSVMGPTQDQAPPVKVEQKPKATDNYTESKIESERIVREAGLDKYCITRLGAVMPSKGVWSLKTLMYGFEIAFNSRIEMILDSDVGLAQITAVEKLRLNLIDSGNTYFLAGGEKCRLKYGDFFNGLLNSLGIPKITKDCFTKKPSFIDWLDTGNAQKDLQFQRYTYNDYTRIFKKNMRRYLPLTRIFGPLVKLIIKIKSPYAGVRTASR
jgi:uncharacterized protein YbjT (DUF2867 family)